MRAVGLALLLGILATPAEAQFIPLTNYRADGSEPFWSLTMDGQRMTFSDSGEETIVPQPRPTGTGNRRRYTAPGMVVTITAVACTDEGNLTHVNTVRVATRGRNFDGCGGGIMPPELLEQTTWRILSINGEDVPESETYRLDFNEGRLTGRAGCNQLSGAFLQAAGQLIIDSLAATRMACPAPQMAHEQAATAILARAQISYPGAPSYDPPIMVLTGRNGGTMLLQLI